MLTELAVTLVGNDYGSEVIGEAIVPYVEAGSGAEGSGHCRRSTSR